jgi:hypothetical protein
MSICMLAKIITSVMAFGWITLKPTTSFYLQAFLVGILPIWAEVLASFLQKVEPARATSVWFLKSDALVDGLVFLIFPSMWFFHMYPTVNYFLIFSNMIFIVAGIYRILRFLKTGLTADGSFIGLPVTYTGYQWLLYVWLKSNNLDIVICFLFLALALVMASKIKVKASF